MTHRDVVKIKGGGRLELDHRRCPDRGGHRRLRWHIGSSSFFPGAALRSRLRPVFLPRARTLTEVISELAW